MQKLNPPPLFHFLSCYNSHPSNTDQTPKFFIKKFASLKIGEQLCVQHRQVRGLLKGDLVDFAHYEEKITVGRPVLGN